MLAYERLLNSGNHLEVFQWDNGQEKGIGVSFKGGELKDGVCLVGAFGKGHSFEEACEDYMRQLSGKTVVFNAYTNRRREVVFI